MAKRARTEGQVWEVVNRERRKKRYTNDGIEMGDWVDYFMGLLGGVERRVVRGMRGEKKGDDGEITREEVGRAIRKVKMGKAVGGDGIPGEVWRFGGERLELGDMQQSMERGGVD